MNNEKVSIRAVIVDDEKGNREFLSGLLKTYCPWVNIVGEAGNIITGAEVVKKQRPELLFLDIRMPGGDGFEMLDDLYRLKFEIAVIFTTAFDDYAVRAFRYSAQDYLLKPIHPLQLKESLEKVHLRISKAEQFERLKHIHGILKQSDENISSILLTTSSGQQKANVSNIVRCEASGNYTLVYLERQRPIMATKSLKEFDELLEPFNFFRAHQSHLVNIAKLVRYIRNKDSGGGKVELDNGDIVEVSRSKKKALKKILAK